MDRTVLAFRQRACSSRPRSARVDANGRGGRLHHAACPASPPPAPPTILAPDAPRRCRRETRRRRSCRPSETPSGRRSQYPTDGSIGSWEMPLHQDLPGYRRCISYQGVCVVDKQDPVSNGAQLDTVDEENSLAADGCAATLSGLHKPAASAGQLEEPSPLNRLGLPCRR